ncbi:MAG: hypothetical protein HY738_06125 [Bacteroidia bacterium]|nr:hypothetical protein [Bacteroidia bacterium]
MKNLVYYFIIIVIIFSACKTTQQKESAVNTKYGGTLRYNENELLKTLYPPNAQDIVSSHIISQIYEGLVRYDSRTLEIVPAIARRWQIDSSGTKYTFFLRNNVVFHDNECFLNGEGRKVTASDFVWSFHLLSTQSPDNSRFKGTIDKIKGAIEYYEASANGKPGFKIQGINALNDSTLEISLIEPNSVYIYLLADISAVVMPKEGIEKYKNKNFVVSGPFRLAEYPQGIGAAYLLRNNKYYKIDKDKNQLPFLDSIKISFISSTQRELKMLESGKLDIVIGLTQKYISEFITNNISKFESNPPFFIIDASNESASYERYSIRSSRLNDFFLNRMSILDLSRVYLAEPKPKATEQSNIQENTE